MKLLLDTHTFLWFLEDSARLSSTAKALIEDGSHEVFVSAGSLWEMAIKISLDKLTIAQPFETFIPEAARRQRYSDSSNCGGAHVGAHYAALSPP